MPNHNWPRISPSAVLVKGKTGFTLIELLVVVSIISLLIAMLLPALAQARASARQIKCASQMRQLAQGTITYIENDRKNLMFGYREIYMSSIYYDGYFSAGYPTLGVASKVEDLFHCPDHPWPLTHNNDWMRTSLRSESSTHYGWPMDFNNNLPVMVRTGDPHRMDEIPHTSTSVLLGETYYNNATRQARGEGFSSFGVYNLPTAGTLMPNKHNGRGNYAFQDGHVATYEVDYVMSHGLTDPSSPIRFSWPAGTY